VMVSSIFLDYFGPHGLMPCHRSLKICFSSQSIWLISDSYHQGRPLWRFWVFSLTILAIMDWCLTVCHRSVKVSFPGEAIWLISDSYHQRRPFVMVLGIFLDYSGRHGLMPDI
jgi:vancomycin permeability regulator SanA